MQLGYPAVPRKGLWKVAEPLRESNIGDRAFPVGVVPSGGWMRNKNGIPLIFEDRGW